MALAHISQAQTSQALDTQLHSINPEEVALALARTLEAETLLHMAEKSEQPPSAETKAVLSALVAETFDLATDPDSLSRKKLIDRHLATYTDSEAISEFYARLGHIRQIAGLIARDNMFRQMREKELPISGGVAELVGRKTHLKTADDAVAMFGKPTFALTLTAHPTNVMGLESIRTQRALTKALDAVRDKKGSTEDVASAMRNYVRAPLLHQDAEGKPADPTPMDETQQMLHALGCIYADLPHIYDRFDKPLTKRFGDYKPETLKLNIDLSSWGSSGDKDGNKNVNATTTLYAIAAHKHEVISRYLKDLSQLHAPALETWKTTLEKADEAALQVMKMCEEHAPIMADADWNNARDILKKEATLDANAWVKSLESAYQKAPTPKLLNLLRRARVFGFTMGRLEYRETANEFSRIAGLFIKDYESLSEAEKQQKLNDLLDTPIDSLKREHQQALAEIAAAGKTLYSDTDARPIAAQTLKRMELARDFPDMVKDQVLAECQNTSNFLETLLLQKLVEKEGKKPQLGVVPLFEEYRVLERAPRIMDDALNNRHYKAHLEALAAQNGGKPTQQIQLAHSDNARRAGMPAARAYIYEAHNTLRQAVEKHGVNVQFFEGGSQSDPYRGGVRSMTASMNEFGIHDFAKFTFQGGDLINKLNYPGSIIRLFTRNIAHAADVLDNAAREQGNHTARLVSSPKKTYDEMLDKAATDALKKTAKDYEKRIFSDPRFGDFLRDIGYLEETEAGNRASRKSARGGKTSEVNVEKTRTIAFSEAFQHAGLCPTWIGAGTLYNNICHALAGDRVSAQTLHAMYKGSPVFADVIDRMLFGLAKPGMGALDEKFGASRMQQKLNAEYRDAFLLAMEAKTGKPYPDMSRNGGTSYGNLSFDEMNTIVLNEGLPHLKQTMQSNQRYLDTLERMKSTLAPNGRTLDETQKLLRALLHDAGDTVHHGRLLHADDHTYGQLMLHHADAAKNGAKDPVAAASAAYERTRDGAATERAGGRAA